MMFPIASDVTYWLDELESADYGVPRCYENGMTITHERATATTKARYVIVLPDGQRRIFEHAPANQSKNNTIRKVADLLAEWLQDTEPDGRVRRLSEQMLSVLAYCHTYERRHGYPPTHQEIADALQRRQPSVARSLRRLEQQGYVERGDGWRNVRVLRLPAA